MPKRVGYLYDKMLNKDLIRFVILESARHKHRRHEVRKALRRTRAVVAVGYRFWCDHVGLHRRNFLRAIRQARRICKKQAAGRPVPPQQAEAFVSRIGQFKHFDSFLARQKYIDPIKIKKLKEVIRNESKRRQCTQRCV
jgi:RNA-directed DNA polymerase